MSQRESFGGKFAFIFAMVGSAIGLGNIWRFPYMVGEYGGAAFIIIYLLCSLFIALPIFCCEAIIGRRTNRSAYDALSILAPGTKWKYLGAVNLVSSFIIVSYYSVVGGWSFDYFVRSAIYALSSGTRACPTGAFEQMTSSVFEPIIAFTAFLGLSAFIVGKGVKGGIERFTKYATPLLGVLIVIVALYSISLPGAKAGIDYLVRPDWSKVNGETFAFALGQAFFSLSLGSGCVVVYSSFMNKSSNIMTSGVWTALFDALFAIIAGFAIMPAVFAAGMEPSAGPSLVYDTIPYIFDTMRTDNSVFSFVIEFLFFLTVLIAALTSSISMLSVCVEHTVDHRHISPRKAVILYFLGTWVLGVICSLSFGPLSGVKLFNLNIFEFCDTLASNYFMTLSSLAGCIFIGWFMGKPNVRDEFTNSGTLRLNCRVFDFLYYLIKWVLPVMIAVIFITSNLA